MFFLSSLSCSLFCALVPSSVYCFALSFVLAEVCFLPPLCVGVVLETVTPQRIKPANLTGKGGSLGAPFYFFRVVLR